MNIRNTNDDKQNAPALKVYMNEGVLAELPENSVWPGLEGLDSMNRLKEDGFEGIQLGMGQKVDGSPIGYCQMAAITDPSVSMQYAGYFLSLGAECLTVHVGTGMEDDDQVFRLVESVLEASSSTNLPIYIETHRATVTQDIWRTVKLTEKFPEIRFNGDFSHYYTGLEMRYGDFDAKLDFMQPIFDRTRFMHGRIGTPGNMQVTIGDGQSRPLMATGEADFLADHKEIWIRAFMGFLKTAEQGDYFIFTPELLSASIYYGRKFMVNGQLTEESDRYAESLIYAQIARECFSEAQKRLK